jgi:hypothetical protein
MSRAVRRQEEIAEEGLFPQWICSGAAGVQAIFIALKDITKNLRCRLHGIAPWIEAGKKNT